MSSEERRHDSNKSENRSDREHDSGSFRASREQRVLYQGHSQSDKGTARRRHTQYDYNSDRSHHRHADSEVSKAIVTKKNMANYNRTGVRQSIAGIQMIVPR